MNDNAKDKIMRIYKTESRIKKLKSFNAPQSIIIGQEASLRKQYKELEALGVSRELCDKAIAKNFFQLELDALRFERLDKCFHWLRSIQYGFNCGGDKNLDCLKCPKYREVTGDEFSLYILGLNMLTGEEDPNIIPFEKLEDYITDD